LCQVLIARRLLLCEYQSCLRLLHLRLVRANLCLLHDDLRIDVLDVRLRDCHLRLRLVKGDPVIAIIDARDHLACCNVLVICHRHGGDVARHLWRDGKLSSRDEGIVGRLEMPAVIPIEVACRQGDDEQKQPEHEGERVSPQEAGAGLVPDLGILLPRRILMYSRHFPYAASARALQPQRFFGAH
jgi:hypothetical protein